MRKLSSPVWLVVINAAIFLVVWMVNIVGKMSGHPSADVVGWLALPSDPLLLLHRPWTIVTYMFTHYDVWHILFNMLTLYWLGNLLLIRFPQRRLVWLYLLGGFAGGILFVGVAQIFPTLGGTLVGASASVMAVVMATAVIMPDFEVYMFMVFRMKLKWVALIMMLLLVFSFSLGNLGGQVAHLGGILVGLAFAVCYFHGRDFTAPLNAAYDWIAGLFKRKPYRKKKLNPRRRQSTQTNATVSELDILLDKIRKSGYPSLTAEERERLNEISKKLK